MKNTFRASWRFLLVLMVISLGQAVSVGLSAGGRVVAGEGPGAFQQPGALPLHVQRARRVLLGAANLLGDGLEARRFLNQQDELGGLQDPLAPEVRAAVRLE